LAGANAARGAEPERDSVSLESSRARSEYSEARERDLRPRPARRPIRGGFRPPVEDIESQSIESVSNERRSGVTEVQPSIEWAANVGSRKKRGRYSTGALFRPREKRLRRPLGGGEAIPDRDWSWPANEEQALSDKEATRVGEEETRVESQAGKEDRSEANGGA
jgi:hypothetical protein